MRGDARLGHLDKSVESIRERLKIPALSAAVVEKQNVIWAKGFGFQDLEQKLRATEHTSYHLASLTKTFASTIIMRLVEQGKVKLDDPVSDYGISFDGKEVVRVKHLLSHTSEGTPGDGYKYNGNRFAQLNKVVEKATGKTFGEVVITEILDPLGLNETAPYLSPDAQGRSQIERQRFETLSRNLALPYALNDDAIPVRGEYPKSFSVSAGLISSVLDMAKYDIAIDRNRFLSRETQQLAFTPMKSNKGRDLPYGLGWFTQNLNGEQLIWHYGYWVCNSSLILKVPRQNITFIAMANTDNLSRPTDLGAGDVTSSPVGLSFLKTFVFPGMFGEAIPEVDWNAGDDELKKTLKGLAGRRYIDIVKKEMVVEARMRASVKRNSDADRLKRIFTEVFPGEQWKQS